MTKQRQRGQKRTKSMNTKRHDDLTPKQKRFCEAYVIDMNGTKAAIAAGFSRKNARSAASTFLTKPNIQREIQKHQAKLAQKTEISAERVVNKLAEIAFGKTDPDLPKPADQLNALAQLGRHLGLFVERHEVDQRTTLLNVSVSAADLESARSLVEFVSQLAEDDRGKGRGREGRRCRQVGGCSPSPCSLRGPWS